MTYIFNQILLLEAINAASKQIALKVEGDQLTITNYDANLVPEGEGKTMTLVPTLGGMLSAVPSKAPVGFSALTLPSAEHGPKGISAMTTNLEDWQPREDDLELPARKGSAHLSVGDTVTCQTRHAYGSKYVVTRIINQGPEAWPIAYMRSGSETQKIDLAPNAKRYWRKS